MILQKKKKESFLDIIQPPLLCGHAWFDDCRQGESGYHTGSPDLGESLMKPKGVLKRHSEGLHAPSLKGYDYFGSKLIRFHPSDPFCLLLCISVRMRPVCSRALRQISKNELILMPLSTAECAKPNISGS